MDKDKIWNEFLTNIRDKISNIAFNTWFQSADLVEITDNLLTIIVPYEAQKQHLETNYYELIEEAFLNITGKNLDINIYLDEEFKNQEVINTEENNSDKKDYKFNSLNNKYTFDNFIVGDTNKFAYLAAMSVAEKPGKLYNPLFIYGNSGLGKTHLMNAIGNYCEQISNKKVLYVTCEDFINDFINVSKKDKNNQNDFDYIDLFKKKYRDIDVLMIDDIQFLGGAVKSQQEFTNTFNSLYHNEKQIVICSDRSVDDLKLVEERLKTRFNWGLTVNIYPPDITLKKEILKKKIKGLDLILNINDEVIEFIANNCGSDVRNLEGALTRLCAYSAIMNNSNNINLEFASEALKDYTNNLLYSQNTVEKILNSVANYYKISVSDMKSKKRTNAIAYPRQIAMYLCRLLTDETYPKIGLEFGGRDHSTVIHAYEKINKDRKDNKKLDDVILEIKNIIM